jgi:PhnB protein
VGPQSRRSVKNAAGSTPVRTTIAPWLSVHDAGRAVALYRAAFGAVVRYRLQGDAGNVMVAQLAVDEADFWVQDDHDASSGAGDGSIRMILTVAEPEAVFRQALAAGATEISPVTEGHGWRIGRLADPFGHHWEVGKPLT